jgi:hypothetical protein
LAKALYIVYEMKSSVTKGNYDELLHSIEREYYNSDLNKLVERSPRLK